MQRKFSLIKLIVLATTAPRHLSLNMMLQVASPRTGDGAEDDSPFSHNEELRSQGSQNGLQKGFTARKAAKASKAADATIQGRRLAHYIQAPSTCMSHQIGLACHRLLRSPCLANRDSGLMFSRGRTAVGYFLLKTEANAKLSLV